MLVDVRSCAIAVSAVALSLLAAACGGSPNHPVAALKVGAGSRSTSPTTATSVATTTTTTFPGCYGTPVTTANVTSALAPNGTYDYSVSGTLVSIRTDAIDDVGITFSYAYINNVGAFGGLASAPTDLSVVPAGGESDWSVVLHDQPEPANGVSIEDISWDDTRPGANCFPNGVGTNPAFGLPTQS